MATDPHGHDTAPHSLGEALRARGNTAAAIRNYEKSVALNPQSRNGIDILKRIKRPPEQTSSR